MLVSFVAWSPSLCAQVTVVEGGCVVGAEDDEDTPNTPENGEEMPVLGNLRFQLEHECPSASNALFVLYGKCLEGPDYPFFPDSPCGSQCTQVVDLASVTLSGTELAKDSSTGELALPIPNVVELSGITLCAQFLCFDLRGDEPSCQQISHGVKIEIV